MFRDTGIKTDVLIKLGEGVRREEACAFDCQDLSEPSTGTMAFTKAYVVSSKSGRAYMKGLRARPASGS